MIQLNLYGSPIESKRTRNRLTDHERRAFIEKKEAHRAWKLYKSHKFESFDIRQKHLLKKYYGVTI